MKFAFQRFLRLPSRQWLVPTSFNVRKNLPMVWSIQKYSSSSRQKFLTGIALFSLAVLYEKEQTVFSEKDIAKGPKDSHELKDIDRQELLALMNQGYAGLSKKMDKDLVLVVGNSDSGKTTAVCYLMGCEMEKKWIPGKGNRVVVKQYKGKESVPKIGHTRESETFYAQIVKGEFGDDYFCDCPGFEETRTKEYTITAQITTQLAVKSAKKICEL